MSFLQQIADYILDKYSNNLDRLVIILPNIRAGVFLSDILISGIRKTSWLPEITSSGDFLERISGLKSADEYLLLRHLYDAVAESGIEEFEFGEFLNWGSVLLHDFKEIDQQLVDEQSIFQHLIDVRTLESWNLNPDSHSEIQDRYLKLTSVLSKIYFRFVETMSALGIGHSGFIERQAVNNATSYKFEKDTVFIVAGFNALTKAETQVFKQLHQSYEVKMFWDYDEYYLNNEMHEAGHFGRLNQNLWKEEKFDWIAENFKAIQKKISIYQCSTSLEQAMFLPQIISKLPLEESDAVKTAIVLPDESVLIPVLQYLPKNIKHVNITMGYSLIHSPYYGLFEALIRLFYQPGSVQSKKSGFYHKDVQRFLQERGLRKILTDNNVDKITELLYEIVDQNLIYISKERLNSVFPEELGLNFQPSNNTTEVLELIESLIRSLDSVLTLNEDIRSKMDRAFLKHHWEVLKSVKSMAEDPDISTDHTLIMRMWKHYSELTRVRFTGEPLRGLQIMGLLETRNLDFKNVVILNVNEGAIPTKRNYFSILPHDVKKQHNLLAHKEKEAVFAYHFYRLLQRAENIHLLFSTQMESLGGGECSRFILQLKHELQRSNPHHQIVESIIRAPGIVKGDIGGEIKKSEGILDKIRSIAARGFSPSSITRYLDCPLDFYYRYVIGLSEQEEAEENIEADVLGNMLHHTLKKLYENLIGQQVKAEDISKMKKEFIPILNEQFSKKFPQKMYLKGKNKITYNLAIKFMEKFLNVEEERVKNNEVIIVGLEEEFSRNLRQDIDGNQVKIRGIVDRIETNNGQLSIIDYKTGTIKSADLSCRELDDVFSGKKSRILQLLMYVWILGGDQRFENRSISAQIYGFKSYNRGFFESNISGQTKFEGDFLEQFEESLTSLIETIFDPEIVFNHNEKAKYCNFC